MTARTAACPRTQAARGDRAAEAGSVWVQRALRADPDVELFTTSLPKLASADVPADALVIVDGACPASVPGADFMLLNPPAGRRRTPRRRAHRATAHHVLVRESDPRLRFLTLDGVELISRPNASKPRDPPSRSCARGRRADEPTFRARDAAARSCRLRRRRQQLAAQGKVRAVHAQPRRARRARIARRA